MAPLKQTLSQIFLWQFKRGSIAYDIIVGLILLFIFITPRSCFERRVQPPAGTPPAAAAAPAK